MQEQKWIVRSDEVLGGTPVFAGTRVPVQTLIDYLQAGHSISEFMDDFPAVNRKHAIGALESLKQVLLSDPNSNRGAGIVLSSTRSTLLSKGKRKLSRRSPESRRFVSASDESKYQSVLTELHNLGWKPRQLSGQQRTIYRLNTKGTVLAIFRSAMKQKRGKWDLYFFGLSKKMFDKHISQNQVYVFLQCGVPSSILVIPGEYFQKCYQGVPTSKGDWKINVYNDGKIWTLKPTGKSVVDVSKYLNRYPVLSKSD